MTGKVLLDTGPLVALLDANDNQHRWAVETFASLPQTLSTCEAVIAEVCFLLARWPLAIDAVFRRIELRALRIESMVGDSMPVHAIMQKYRNVPASYADACLVRLSERFANSNVFTTDSDFQIYRRNRRQPIPVVGPFSEG